jgi:hypothetical protein
VLRVGGNSVDKTTWSPGGAGGTTGAIAKPDVDRLAAFAKATGWKVIYGVRFAGSTPATAADEAGYAASALGSQLAGFEIGNEPDLYASNGLEPTTFTYADFRSAWESYAAAILAKAPGSALTGPAASYSFAKWTIPFAADEASRLSLLTQHWYRANGKDPASTIDLLLSPDPTLATELHAIADAAAANHIVGGFRFAETNSFYNGGAPGISDGFGTALWVLDYLFTHARYGSRGVNLHGGNNGPGYTPIADAAGAVVGPRPEYYGLSLFARATPGDMVQATTSTTDPSLRAYAVTTPAGATNVIVVNASRTTAFAATIDLGVAPASAESLVLTAPSLDATTGITLGGVTLGPDGSGSPAATAVAVSGTKIMLSVPASSATLVTAK